MEPQELVSQILLRGGSQRLSVARPGGENQMSNVGDGWNIYSAQYADFDTGYQLAISTKIVHIIFIVQAQICSTHLNLSENSNGFRLVLNRNHCKHLFRKSRRNYPLSFLLTSPDLANPFPVLVLSSWAHPVPPLLSSSLQVPRAEPLGCVWSSSVLLPGSARNFLQGGSRLA